MAWVEVEVRRSREIAAERERVHQTVADTPTVAELIPRVQTATPLGPDTWRWTLEEHHALGHTVQPAFTVRIEDHAPSGVRFVHQPDPGAPDGRAGGGITLVAASSEATTATVDVEVSLDLPIPRLIRGAARALIELEVRRSVDRFLAALDERVTTSR